MRVASPLLGSIVAAAGCGVCCYLAATTAPRALPALDADRTSQDFGVVRQHEQLTGEFRVTNRTKLPVEFGQIVHGCSCTNAEVTPTELPAGETATVRVVWKTGRRRGATSERFHVPARLPDGTPLDLSFHLSAVVQPDTTLQPERVSFGVDSVEETVRLTDRVGTARILAAYPEADWVQARAVEGGSGLVLHRSLAADGKARATRVLVHTTDQADPWLTLDVAESGSAPPAQPAARDF